MQKEAKIIELLPLRVFPFTLILRIRGSLAVSSLLHFRLYIIPPATFSHNAIPLGHLKGLIRYVQNYMYLKFQSNWDSRTNGLNLLS